MPIQAAHSELEKRSIIVYGVPQSKTEVAADRVRHDIKSLESYLKCALAKDKSITPCKAIVEGRMIQIQLIGPAQFKLYSAA